MPAAGVQEVPASSRALVAAVDLHRMTPKRGLYPWLYRQEEAGAERMIRTFGTNAYRSLAVLSGERASFPEFLEALHRFEVDPEIEAVDVILYLHGHSARDYPEPEICFVVDTHQCMPSREVIPPLLGFRKLRILFSDACFGAEENQDWLRAGFKAVTGSIGTDTNFATDLKRFLKKWTGGATFEESLRFANSGRFGKALDRILGGDSTKIPGGAVQIRIDDLEE